MNVETIQQDKDLVKKLAGIHKNLTSLLKDDVEQDQYSYQERDFPLGMGVNHLAVSEHVAQNRMKKINALKNLSDNWDNFKALYKEDSIMNKIGEEFIKGKLEFNDTILNDIKSYPFKKQVLHYFKKGVEVQMPDVKAEDYVKMKEQIFPYLELNTEKHMERKQALLKAIEKIDADKTQSNLEKKTALHGTSDLGTVDVEYGTFMSHVKAHIKAGDFKFEQYGSKMTVEVPITGTMLNNGIAEKVKTSMFSVDLNNPLDYSMQVGTLEKPRMSIEDRIRTMRTTNFPSVPVDPHFKVVK